MSDDQLPIPPPLPDPATVGVWAGQIRAILPLIGGLAGGFGLTLPWLQSLTDAQINVYVTGVLVLIALGTYMWSAIGSYWAKIAAKNAARATAVASAVASAQATMNTGRPTPVTVAPAPPESPHVVEATHIAPVEIAAAPVVTGPIKPA